MPTGLEKQMAKRATNCGETPLYTSKVMAPRNPKLVRGPAEDTKLTPSYFMKELSQSTEERLANTHDMKIPQIIELMDMGENTHQKFSVVNVDEPLFQPFPSEIVFQQFEPHDVYEVPLILRNNDKVSRLVKVYQADSPYFKIISPPDIATKVAPGMPTVFKIQFIPTEKKDYSHELICMTEREKFLVPVKAVGARAVLDFPDQVNFSTCLVKHPNTRTLLVRNIGNREAKFALNIPGPFDVSPPTGLLAIQESMQVEITFKPVTIGDHCNDLVISYDTGEDVNVTLYGAAVDANVRLDKNSLRIENTFISMANQRTVTISNRSDVIVHYQFKPLATREEEEQQKERYFGDLGDEEANEYDSFLEECNVDPTLRDKMAILSRTFQNRKKIVEGDDMLFADDVFTIEPREGDIWPNSKTEINVVFKPNEAQSYTRTAYCDITGRETRLPLRLRGDGVGPQVEFSFDTLDMGYIFVGSTHTYEVVISNRGDIDAIYSLIPSQSTFSPRFTFIPNQGVVIPGGHQGIQIAFSSPILGNFDEDFYFDVEGLPTKLKLNTKGCVIGPTFHFDLPRLKFGTISYGFKNAQTVTLVNTALVAMTYQLRVPGDGSGEVVCATSGEVTLGRTNLTVPSREFVITPHLGTIAPQSEVKIEVELTSNTVKKYDMAMVVDVEGVGNELLALPISAKCVVPAIAMVTPIIDYKRCFLNHPYGLNAELFNDSDLPAKYDLVPQLIDETATMLYTSPQPTGIIPPHSTIEVPLVVTPQALEEIEAIAEFSIFGSTEPPQQVQLLAIGEGPVVLVSPPEIDWGQTPVLTDVTRIVTLSNESLIPAPFRCTMMRPNTMWVVEPSEGEILPEESIELRLTVNLDDCIRFHDKLAVEFENSQTRVVKIQAYGHSTTIVSDPPITPSVQLGHHFSKGPIKCYYTLTNKGRRHQQLFWSTEGFNSIKLKNREKEYNSLDVKYQRMPPPAPPPRPVFTLTPSRCELEPGQSIEVTLEGQSDEPKIVKERMICHAIIGKSSGKERIMKTDICIEFISPLLEFSTKQVMFRVDKHPEDVLVKQLEELTLMNVSSLPLTTYLELEEPFQFITGAGDEVCSMELPMDVGESHTLTVQFDPAYQHDAHSRVSEKIITVKYQEHPHVDYVGLRGEVYFPNLTFQNVEVDFGCILNDTEVTRYVEITNNSPMPVKFAWSFLEPITPIMLYPTAVPEMPMDDMAEGDHIVAFDDEPTITEVPVGEMDQEGGFGGGGGAAPDKNVVDDTHDTEAKLGKDDDAANMTHPTETAAGPIQPEPLHLESSSKISIMSTKKGAMSDRTDMEGGGGGKKLSRKGASRKSTGKSHPKSTSSKSGTKTPGTGTEKERKTENVVKESEEVPSELPEAAHSLKMVAEEKSDSAGVAGHTSSRPPSAARRRKAKLAYIQTIAEPTEVGIEEVFDILPLYGVLMPGESDTVTFTFYGHTDIGSEAKALCDVEGGPCYELDLKGEASIVQYEFDTKYINYGRRMFDQVAEAEIILGNTGKVAFDFNAINMDPSNGWHPLPGVPILIPHAGHIEAHSELRLQVKFLPGIPAKFHKGFEIQVAHFEPDSINICGEGVFPRISLDLPRIVDTDVNYSSLLKEAKENLGRESKKSFKQDVSTREATPLLPTILTPRDATQVDVKSIISIQNDLPSELDLQMETERLVVKEFAINQQQQMLTAKNQPNVQTMTSHQTTARQTGFTSSVQTSRAKKSIKNTKPKARLPDYSLDFGYVVLGTVRTHIVRATNTGFFPASFAVNRSSLAGSGFIVELDKVRHLPGWPEHETVDFRVSFDPRGGNLELGNTQALVPINIINGPILHLRLRANVTMPDMQLSTDLVDFGPVQCGHCNVVTIQLHNNQHVKCEWTSLATDKERKVVDKHMPLHLRRKLKPDKPRPRNFEMMPPSGMLLPGQKVNVQIKFMPTEEKVYSDRVTVRIAQSSQRLMLMVNGVGQEPRLEIQHGLMKFGPILPHSLGDEVDVVVKNPCQFPVEFYSLDFDPQYLEEEKMLRMMKGYDEHGTILLPPRHPGDRLPTEILDYYEEQQKYMEDEEKAKAEAVAVELAALQADGADEYEEGVAPWEEAGSTRGGIASVPTVTTSSQIPHTQDADTKDTRGDKPSEHVDKTDAENAEKKGGGTQDKKATASSSIGVGELLEITPVSAAIAKHLGIDLTTEGKGAMRRRGVALVVHGAPLSGKTSTAIALAKYYEAALLTVDSVVLEAISNGNTPAGLRAREMCSQAAKSQLVKDGDGPDGQTTAGGLSVEAVAAHAKELGSASQSTAGGAHSIISNRKTSTISGHKPEGGPGDKKEKKDKKQDDNTTQLSTSPPPGAPVARRLSVSASVAGEEGLMSCIFPNDLLVDLLAERMQLNDCHRGIVFDGLETLFSPNHTATTSAILKAFNNRKFVYFITLRLEQAVLQAREKRQHEDKDRLEKSAEKEEKRRLEEMSEDEYDALSEGERARIDQKRLKAKKERLHKKELQEKLEREKKERELAALLEEKRLEDDKNKKKKGGKGQEKETKGTPAKKGQEGGKAGPSASQVAVKKLAGDSKHDPPTQAPSEHGLKAMQSTAIERPESHGTAGSEPQEEGVKKRKGKDKGRPISNEVAIEAELEKDPIKEAELLLTSRFKAFEHGMRDIEKVLARWDRTIGQIVPDPNADDVEGEDIPVHPPSGRKGKSKADREREREKERERLEKERLEKEKAEKAIAEDGEDSKEYADKQEDKEELGVPHIIMDASEPDPEMGYRVLDTGCLPSSQEVLDGLGLGPNGPSIPPPAYFSVIPYPVKRKPPLGSEYAEHYVFVASSPDDPNVLLDEKSSEPDGDPESSTPDKGRDKDDHTTPTGKGKGRDKMRSGAESSSSRRRSAKGSRNRKNSIVVTSPPPGTSTPASDFDGQSSVGGDGLQESKNPKLGIFRWTIASQGEVVLRLRFQSDELGQFDQTLNFEIVGTRRRYQLFCRGVCAFPNISREPRIVFPHRKKSKRADEIVHKKYILSTETLMMGPLLAGKSRERYKEGKYPENMEKLTICNTSPLEAEVTFSYQHDSNSSTFLMDPQSMMLKPGEQQELMLWVYPKNQGYFEDTIVCCIKENPQPVLFKIACYGVRPELELDKKQLQFEKVLLHRKDTKTIFLRNSTLLPVAWRLSGLENLGDDFSVTTESGVIEPKSEFALNAHFRAMKSINLKKMIRLEVSDVENIMGLLQTENVQVLAEAYDVALDMSFPKGADGGLDFGVIRVMDETKQTCSLRNKGRYDIEFRFLFEHLENAGPEIVNLFSVIPQKGILVPNDRLTQVQVIFKSRKEVTIDEQPILKCQVIEPSMTTGGEMIASIPVKLSVRSIFTKYNIFPVTDINFGPVLINQRKHCTFIIENKGEFDFKYTITRMMRDAPHQPMLRGRAQPGGNKRTKSRDGSSSGRSITKPKRAESISGDNNKSPPKTKGNKNKRAGQDIGGGGGGGGGSLTRLQLGMFTVFPAIGMVSPGNQQVIQVECQAEVTSKGDEDLAIEISDRDPADHPQGIPYKILAEACSPGINMTDIGSIFEEHRVVKNLSVFLNNHQLELDGGGVFGEDENKFIFGQVLVGRKAKARFKISNRNKVACDVMFSCKLVSTKASSKLQDIFDVDPTRASILANSHVYATVIFSPPSMQTYQGSFEVGLEGLTGPASKQKNFSFEVQGEGNLPRVSVVKPTVRNKKGTPILLFTKLLLGQTQRLPLALKNEGTLPSKVDIDITDASGMFELKSTADTKLIYPMQNDLQPSYYDNETPPKRPHTASIIAGVGEEASFEVVFKPNAAQRCEGTIRCTVVDNQYEDRTIQLVGEGYQEEVTLENIHGFLTEENLENMMGDKEEADAAPSNLIQFGDCHVTVPRQLSFTMCNHSTTDTVRFQWPDHPQVKFSPAVGHLHHGCSKDIAITFKADKPITLQDALIGCKVHKIAFEQPLDQVLDWDDRMRTFKWVDIPVVQQHPHASSDLQAVRPNSTRDKKDEEKGKKEHKKGAAAKEAAAKEAAAKEVAAKEAAAAAEPLEKEKAEEMLKKEAAFELPRPAKKKVVETEPEPSYTMVDGGTRDIELRVSATADYAKYKCKTDSIHFKDTLMFQTRQFAFQMTNKANVQLSYSWQIVIEEILSHRKSVSFADEDHLRLPSRCSSVATSEVMDVEPFIIKPDVGHILAGKKQNFTVKFSPLDMNDYEGRLICRIPNLKDSEQGPVISVRGRSLMPYCHFELEDSDYITGARRNPELCGPGGAPPGATLDQNTRVIEFSSTGINVKNKRHFFIVNPTSAAYTYVWTCEDDPDPKRKVVFTCLTSKGLVMAGKKSQICFEFAANQLGIIESFWRFTIPEQNISVPFLLVGDAKEPAVSTDWSHVNFKSLLLGTEAHESVNLINNESIPFHFNIVEDSCHTEGFSSKVIVSPMDGVIPANGRLPISVSFTPHEEKEVNFNIQIEVKKRTQPICLNVKAEGYAMNTIVMCEDSMGKKVQLSHRGINELNFGEVEVNEKSVRSIFIINSGKFNFDYKWVVSDQPGRSQRLVSITQEEGSVPAGERKRCVLAFKPPFKTSLRGCDLLLKVANGPSYQIKLAGQGVVPGLQFSFTKYDFGPCFIHRAGMPTHSTILTITNKDSKDISVDCLYTSTTHLEIQFIASVLSPGDTRDVNITFYPREAIKYQETVIFEINSLSKNEIEINGLGTEMRVEVANPKDRIVNLGALRVGQVVRRPIPIVNNSPAPLSFNMVITPLSPILQQLPHVLSLAPLQEIILKAKGGSHNLDVVFSPKCRIPQFTEEVMLECAGLSQPLLVLTGSCQGIDISLDQESIPFGAVFLRSSTTRKLLMCNTGDIGAAFKWNTDQFNPDFAISPSEGYVSPGMTVPFEVTFSPTELSQDIRYDKLRCHIEGSRPLRLVLTGMCVGCQPQKEVLHFNTHVRIKDTRHLTLHNRTNQRWELKPVIEGEHWTGADMITVEPLQSKQYEITYRPLIMTVESKKHMEGHTSHTQLDKKLNQKGSATKGVGGKGRRGLHHPRHSVLTPRGLHQPGLSAFIQRSPQALSPLAESSQVNCNTYTLSQPHQSEILTHGERISHSRLSPIKTENSHQPSMLIGKIPSGSVLGDMHKLSGLISEELTRAVPCDLGMSNLRKPCAILPPVGRRGKKEKIDISHKGTVFFALPDGTGLLYNLTGLAEAPKAAGSITRDVPSKTHYTELLTVSNWLRRPQRFKVLIEMMKPDKLDLATTMKGLDYIDVPGLSKRDYKLHFYCHKEASFAAKAVFRNEVTGEFQFYYVTFKSTAPGIIGTIEMATPVRLSTSHLITVENPLSFPITFTTNCSVADIMLPSQLATPPQSEGAISIEYLPLKVGSTNGKLTLTSNELGLYSYDLALTATAAGPEKAVYFRAPLGGSHQQSTKFQNFAKVKTEYQCKIDSTDFHCEKSITAAPSSSGGSEVAIDITFEPSRLGETRATLTVNSTAGGEYSFPLFGTCIPPKPQGPYTVKANSTSSIPFRNIFPHTTAFTFQVDNPAFSCKSGDSIRGKKMHNIIVSFEGNLDGSKAPKMGKLVVTCPRSAGGAANVAWTYYLKGLTL